MWEEESDTSVSAEEYFDEPFETDENGNLIRSDEEIYQLLVEKIESGLDVNLQDSAGWTPLINAAYHGYDQCLALVIKHGANISAKDDDEFVPLMFAAISGHINCLKLLLEAGAKTDDSDSKNETAIRHAIRNEHLDCVKLLIAFGASYDLKNLATEYELSDQMLQLLKCADSIDNNQNLSPEVKNIVKAIVFSYDWDNDAEYDLCFDEAKSTVEAFLAKIQHHDKTTKTFISEHCLLIDKSLQEQSFKKWDLDKINPMKALVNFAFLHGDKVDNVSSLSSLVDCSSWTIKHFFASIVVQDGVVGQYSVGEYFARIIAKDPASQLFKKTDATHLWNKIANFLAPDDIKLPKDKKFSASPESLEEGDDLLLNSALQLMMSDSQQSDSQMIDPLSPMEPLSLSGEIERYPSDQMWD